jgi:ribosomal protein L7/L12
MRREGRPRSQPEEALSGWAGQDRFDVVLTSRGDQSSQQLTRILRGWGGISKKQAERVVSGTLPQTIFEGAGYATAVGVKEAFERRGAEVELRHPPEDRGEGSPASGVTMAPGRHPFAVPALVLAIVAFAATLPWLIFELATASAWGPVMGGCMPLRPSSASRRSSWPPQRQGLSSVRPDNSPAMNSWAQPG